MKTKFIKSLIRPATTFLVFILILFNLSLGKATSDSMGNGSHGIQPLHDNEETSKFHS